MAGKSAEVKIEEGAAKKQDMGTEKQGGEAKKQDCVMVFCAHNDDNIVGAGGTIAKYSSQGIRVVTVIFSYGQMSHPHLREKVVIDMRVSESTEAKNILGEDRVIYLGLKEGSFVKEAEEKNIAETIVRLIESNKPSKIFSHSIDDPHPDHQAVFSIINEVLDTMKYKGSVYSFDVWNLVNIRRRDRPKLVVDITDTFDKKVEAFRAHKSQWTAQLMLMWSIYLKAILNGRNTGHKYAEVFLKIR